MDRSELRRVDFHGDGIVSFMHEGRPMVSMRRIVENMGLDWKGQSVKLKSNKEKFSCGDITTRDARGSNVIMLCSIVTARLQDFCSSTGGHFRTSERLNPRRPWRFPIARVVEWLAAGGRETIEEAYQRQSAAFAPPDIDFAL